jgi:hypothetical protein
MDTMLEIGTLDGSQVRRLYVSGDTLLIDELSEIPTKFDSIDAGILHLGGTQLPAGRRLPFGMTVTMDGRQGAGAVEVLGCRPSFPCTSMTTASCLAAGRLQGADGASRLESTNRRTRTRRVGHPVIPSPHACLGDSGTGATSLRKRFAACEVERSLPLRHRGAALCQCSSASSPRPSLPGA